MSLDMGWITKLRAMRVRDSTILMAVTGFYIATLIAANATAGKLFDFFGVAVSVGAFAYMACISASDILVDLYGPRTGYRLVAIGCATNVIVVGLYQIALWLPGIPGQELQRPFEIVFGSSTSVIVGSLCSYPVTEVFEVYLWKRLKTATHRKHMWLRNLLVPVFSQFIDATLFFNLAFFLVPKWLYGQPLIPVENWLQVMGGAWLYGLWKGVLLGALDYPLFLVVMRWLRHHRIADVPELDVHAREEMWESDW